MNASNKYHITANRISEELLLIEAAQRDMKHFEELYNRYYEPVFRFVYQRVDSKEQAFDCTSQVFLKAMLHIKKYVHKGLPFSSWLYRIAYNEVQDCYRNQKAQQEIAIGDEHLKQLAQEVAHDDVEELFELLEQVLPTLPEQDLQLVEMRFFEQRPFKEIAEILAITETHAKVKLYRVLDKVKQLIISKSKVL